MKPYNLVIESSLKDCIETTNIAISLGYVPVGGIQDIGGQYIQSIYKPIISNQMNNQFFTELAGMLEDKQQAKITIQKTGEELTVMITAKGKMITCSGSPAEMDENLIPGLKAEIEKGTFTMTVADAPASDKDEEEEDEKEDPKEDKKKEMAAKRAEAGKKGTTKRAAPAKPETKKEEPKLGAKLEAKLEEKKSEDPEVKGDDQSEAQNKQRVFNDAMARGLDLFKNKKYEESQKAYQEALDIFPDDKAAKEQHANVTKWVKMVAEL
jgi:hypothetical protein